MFCFKGREMCFSLMIIVYLILHVIKITVPQTANVLDQVSVCEFYNGIILQEGYFLPKNSSKALSWFACSRDVIGGSCPRGSRMCLQESDASPVFPLNLGDSLTVVPEELSHTTRYLHSKTSKKCKEDSKRNYTLYISLDESAVKSYVRRCDDDKCAFELRIPDPRSELSCTKRVEGGFILDFRKLTDDFVEESEGMTRVLNLCRSATRCDDPNVSSCSYASTSAAGNRTVWGDVTTQRITYENGAVQFEFRRGSKRSGGVGIKVDLHCNWTAVKDGNPIYLSKISSQRISKFVVQSSLGCVKLPMNCKFVGDDYNEYEYDLSDLYRTDGGVWDVENDRNTPIRMNICGPLQNSIGECKKTHAQICGQALFDRRRQQLSYGSILVDKRTDGDDILTARLVHGSVCPTQSNITLSANLKWKCSSKEKGPKLISISECSIDIFWETPKACPARVIASSSLHIYDHLGNRNLTGLCEEDRTSSVTSPSSSSPSYVIYNFCMPLKRKCNGTNNASVCLYRNRNEKILGYYKKTKLYSRNGILSMEFTGDSCLKTNVSFHCDYSAPVSGIVQIFQIDGKGCNYHISVKTPSACATKLNDGGNRSKVCTMETDNDVYDLTALTKYDENYRLVNSNGDEYHLNICNPLITSSKSMCKPNSAICLHNTSEPNFQSRFFTIGNYPGIMKLQNRQVYLEFTNGDMCSNWHFASAKITFQCRSDHHDDTPVLVKSDGCRYEFIWTTNISCPKPLENRISYKNSYCVIPYGIEKFLNFTSIKNKLFHVYHEEEQANLTFNICSRNYTKTYPNGNKEILYFNRTVTDKNMEYYLAHQINCKMTSKKNWNTVNIEFDCPYNEEDGFDAIKINNCTKYIRYSSVLFCKKLQKAHNMATTMEEKLESIIGVLQQKYRNFTFNKHVEQEERIDNSSLLNINQKGQKNEEKSKNKNQSTFSLQQQQQQSLTIYKNITVCIIKIGTREIHLNRLSPVTIQSQSGNRYTIGLSGSNGRDVDKCNGYICKGNISVATLNTCPNVTAIDSDRHVTRNPDVQLIFDYTLQPQGQRFKTTMVLKCNETEEKTEVNEENDTSLTLSYPIGDFCLPLVTSSPNTPLLIAGCTILTVIFIVIVTYYLYKRKKYLKLRKSDKTNLYLYVKNAEI